MSVETKSLSQHQAEIERLGLYALLAHIPIFWILASYFDTQKLVAVGFPLILVGAQLFFSKFSNSRVLPNIMFGFNLIAFSGIMIHLGKGMIEWHFHIFVAIGILTLMADYLTLISAALTAAIHHTLFYFLLPSSVFNYEASLGIVAIHAAFVVIETAACLYVAKRFKESLTLQFKLAQEVIPLAHFLEQNSSENIEVARSLDRLGIENASSVSKLSEASTELLRILTQAKTYSEETKQVSEQTQSSVSEGAQLVSELKESSMDMESLEKEISALKVDTQRELKKVVNSVTEVLNKTNLINDIVFQTKLLSFNASVEAARAGAHGKGFAVVAEEVGNLASSSGKAASEISELAGESQQALSVSVDRITKEFLKTEEKCQKVSTKLGANEINISEKFNVITESMSKLNNCIKEIQKASRQQEAGIQQMDEEIKNIFENGSKIKTSTTQVSDSADIFNQRAGKLKFIFNDINKELNDNEDELDKAA